MTGSVASFRNLEIWCNYYLENITMYGVYLAEFRENGLIFVQCAICNEAMIPELHLYAHWLSHAAIKSSRAIVKYV
jgi:hypothetical protein